MQIEPIDLRARIEQVRLSFDTRLAEVLLDRPDLSQDAIGRQFGVSRNVIRRVMKQFNINTRKRGPKPVQRVLNA
jgi:DNA-binding GntR family transcriptional regulator